MSKVLDLSVYTEETFDITFPSGEVIKVQKPTQKIVISMVAVSKLANSDNQINIIDGMVELCAAIISNNKEGKQFSVEWVENNLDIMMISAIIKGYSEFTSEIQQNPI